MIELEDIKLEDIKKIEISKPYNLIYLDYNKEEGIKIFKNDNQYKRDINTLSDDDLKNMYRLYIFNNDSMIIIYNFGNEYKYSRIDKEDFKEGSDKKNIKYIYLKESDKEKYKDKTKALNERLKVRVGNVERKIKDKNGEEKVVDREVIQYIGYIGGEN
ncbi:hypothetical protein [Fusobacterium pseudoperiodonticum]|uniref:Uncharacterized protein n=1 Tax=Fusobacterium pseudoperiodonticum TaxID=2663009 RepID=A0A2D3PT45_9FUSO|nr:hypothetical protein [Fusobacterium pseudoperiodonticum]ATV70840.1 hypothetical protein CTM98_09400 [Fusobacterium pseudoperiodonticum]